MIEEVLDAVLARSPPADGRRGRLRARSRGRRGLPVIDVDTSFWVALRNRRDQYHGAHSNHSTITTPPEPQARQALQFCFMLPPPPAP
jgi:hypothetical protein